VVDRTTDRIAIRGLTAYAHHGVYAFERRQGQTFKCDAVLEVDTSPAASSDDLERTVNYAELAQRLYTALSTEPVDLLETLAQRLADVCLGYDLVAAVEITVHKPEADLGVPFDDVTVTIRMTRAVFSLGANLGDRAGAIRSALTALKDDGLVARSVLYETPPWGPVEQPPYLNAIAVVRGPRDAPGWLTRAHELEQAAGRTREVRWGARTLDVDVVTVTEDDGRPVVSDDPQLTLPHPRAHERAFVLVPWLVVDPGAEIPGRGRVADLIAALPREDVDAVIKWERLE